MRIAVFLLSFLFLTACEENVEIPGGPFGGPDLVISTGTSFGECIGYCREELIISGEGRVEYVRSSWTPRDPDLTATGVLDEAEWESLRAQASPDLMSELGPVLGCPDCADGGAEWVRIETRDEADEVIFEFEADVAELGLVLPALRELRTRYRELAVP